MRRGKTRAAAFAAALLMLATLFMGCSGSNTNQAATTTQAAGESTTAQNDTPAVTPETADDSSDLPDWTGKQLTLNYWNGQGTGGKRLVPPSPKNVVTPEIKRVTGVTLDEDNSFDNSGTDYNQKLALITAAGEWPNLIWNAQDPDTLIKKDLVYDLTDLIPQYCPNIVKKFPDQYVTMWDGVDGGTKGKKFGVVFHLDSRYISLIYPEYDKDEYDRLYFGNVDSFRQPIYVRDDILKELFPSARSRAELMQAYVDKGSFTKDEIYDVPINSKDDFYDLLYKIRDMKKTEGANKPIWPTYARSGEDNWALLAYFLPSIYGVDNTYTYYAYYDKAAKQMKFTYQDPLFKTMVSDINKLVRDGIMPKESMTDTKAQFDAKFNNGQYAVTYAWFQVNNDDLKKNGKTYQYRQVFPQISIDQTKYPTYAAMPSPKSSLMISKKSVKEEDLPQILKYFDYMCSDAGDKMLDWGPKSAGLFTETNGVRKFTDADLEDEIVNNKPKDKFLEYGLFTMESDETKVQGVLLPSFTWAIGGRPWGAGRFNPDYVYKKANQVRNPNDYGQKFNANLVDPVQNLMFARDSYIWNFAKDECPLMNNAWKKKNLVEDALMKCYTGLSDEKFEAAFANFQSVCKEQVGYTDDAQKEMQDYFFNVYNKDFGDGLK